MQLKDVFPYIFNHARRTCDKSHRDEAGVGKKYNRYFSSWAVSSLWVSWDMELEPAHWTWAYASSCGQFWIFLTQKTAEKEYTEHWFWYLQVLCVQNFLTSETVETDLMKRQIRFHVPSYLAWSYTAENNFQILPQQWQQLPVHLICILYGQHFFIITCFTKILTKKIKWQVDLHNKTTLVTLRWTKNKIMQPTSIFSSALMCKL